MDIESKPLRKLLNFRSSEFRLLGLFYLHALMSGLGLALLLTLSLIHFLENQGAGNIPQAFILTGAFMLFVGYVFARLEHSLKPTVLFRSVAIGVILFLIFMRINDNWLPTNYSAIMLFVGFYLINQVHNLEFWGVASVTFNVRQSKRLFPLLSSGESLAKIVGYLLAPLVIQYAGLIELLSVSAVCFVISAWVLEFILSRYSERMTHGYEKKHHEQIAEFPKDRLYVLIHLRSIFKIFSGKYIRTISLLAGLAVIVQFIVTYAFLDQVQAVFEQREALASFFAIFFAFAKMGNLVMKSFLTGRLYKKIGLLAMLLLTPVAIFICLAVGGVTYIFLQTSMVFLLVFASAMFVEELLRTSSYKPSFLILFQPLLSRKRLEGHTAVKGFVEPLGIILAGVLLVLIVQIVGAGLKTLAIILLILTVLWIIMTVLVNREYLATLMNSLVKRTFRSDISLNVVPGISNYLLERLNSRDLRDVDYALKMLREHDPEKCKDRVVSILREKGIQPERLKVFLKQASQSAKGIDITAIEPYLGHFDIEVRSAAILAYAAHSEPGKLDKLLPFLQDKSLRIKKAAVRGLIEYGGIYGSMHAGPVWLEWIENSNPDLRIAAAELFEEIGNPAFFHPLEKLLIDEHNQVRLTALRAARLVRNPVLIDPILQNLNFRTPPVAVFKTLEYYGDDAVQPVFKSLGERGNINKKVGLAKLLVKNFEAISKDDWFSLFDASSLRIRDEIWRLLAVKGLFFLPEKELKSRFEEELDRYALLLECLSRVKHRHKTQLKKAIEAELINIRFNIFNISCLITADKGLCVVADALLVNKAELSPNALDTIESLCHKPIKDKLINLFEQNHNNQQKYLHKFYPDYRHLRDMELYERVCGKSARFSDWLLANLIHYEGKSLLILNPSIISTLSNKPSRVLCEQIYNAAIASEDDSLRQHPIFEEQPFSGWIMDYQKKDDKQIFKT